MPDLDKIYRLYIKWKSRPITPKDPQSDEEFATKYKISKLDLVGFIERPEYQDDLLTSSLNWAKAKTPELLHLVYNEVKLSKSVGDLEKFMNLVHDVKRKDKDDKAGNNFFFFQNLKPEQYASIIAREAKLVGAGGEESSAQFLPTA